MGEMADYYLEQDAYDIHWEESCGLPIKRELSWKTKEGEVIPVSNMKKSHINNTLNLLKRRKQDADFWIAIFEDELKERK